MLIPSAVARRHAAETTLLVRFVAGNPEAAHSLLQLLGSDDQASRESVMEVISNDADLLLWQRLLHHVALHRSPDCTDGHSPAGPGLRSARIPRWSICSSKMTIPGSHSDKGSSFVQRLD